MNENASLESFMVGDKVAKTENVLHIVYFRVL